MLVSDLCKELKNRDELRLNGIHEAIVDQLTFYTAL